jgi:hypothetical protein
VARIPASHSRHTERSTSNKQEHSVDVANASCDDKEMPDPMEMKAPVVENQKHGASRIAEAAYENPS